MTKVEELVRHLRLHGVDFWVEDDRVRYRVNQGHLTDEAKAFLRTNIDEVKEIVAAWWRHVEHLRAGSIAAPVGLLAAAGFWFSLDDGWPHIHATHGADVEAALVPLESLVGREDELAEFLAKTDDQLTAGELLALGFRRSSEGAPILRPADAPEPLAWLPPPDWGTEGDGT